MRRMLLLTISIPLAALAATSCSSDAKRATSASERTDASGTTSAPRGTPTEFVMTGPMPAITAPFCDAAQHCVYPSTNVLHLTGDWAGDIVQGGNAVTDVAASKFAGATQNVFVGTITGCGTGTAVVRIVETGTLTPATGEGTWDVIAGFGTGDLASLTGSGTGTGRMANGERTSTQTGTIRCDGA